MIADLSAGDKLSLKGKIFELQKKLKLIDLESTKQKRTFIENPNLPTFYTRTYTKQVDGGNGQYQQNIGDVIRQVYLNREITGGYSDRSGWMGGWVGGWIGGRMSVSEDEWREE